MCAGNDNNFVVINQKGIDPPSLDLLARAGVSCLYFCRSVTEITPTSRRLLHTVINIILHIISSVVY